RTLSQIATLISSPESGKGIVFSLIFSFQDLELCQRARSCRHSVFNLADSSSSDPEHFRKLDLRKEELFAEAPELGRGFHCLAYNGRTVRFRKSQLDVVRSKRDPSNFGQPCWVFIPIQREKR